ncbi:MAG: phosphotransferase [Clostridiales bacterium]|nr:phosphotransferase [Clostridiales bacterium]
MESDNYAEYVRHLAVSFYGKKILGIKYLGGGFYGRVFEAKLCVPPYNVIIKLHLLNNMSELERQQTEVLRTHAKIKMPEIYGVVKKTTVSDYDAILMEKIRGKRLDTFKKFSKKHKGALAEQIIDNLINWHNVTNDTFGEIGGKQYAAWKDYLGAIIEKDLLIMKTLQKDNAEASILYKEIKNISEDVDRLNLDNVKAALVHGEYNTRNIFKVRDKITGVIDPFAAGFADREFALHQLDALNGKQLGLLELYKSKVKLSDNFEKKSGFYKLFLELRHHLAVLRIEDKHITRIRKLIDEYKSI